MQEQPAQHEAGADELIAAAQRDASDLARIRRAHRPAPDALPGYRLIREIGRGGMGVVYEARQDQPPRVVALKVMRGGVLADPRRLRLFEREVATLALLHHPGIAPIYHAGRTGDGCPFFTMELVQGEPLTEYVARRQLPLTRRLRLFCQVCEAVIYAHQRGVIHRDLKPSNILVDQEGRPRILDFGLARLLRAEGDLASISTVAGSVAGTLAYMSPEQARGEPEAYDTRSDVYSLGVILYQMLTGHLPYAVRGTLLHQAVRTICEQPPRKPSAFDRTLRGEVETIVLKALEKEPERRYQSAAALRNDLERYLAGQPILAHPPSTVYQLRKLAARHKLPVTLTVAMLLLVAGFGVLGTVQAARVARQRDRALAAETRATREAQRAAAANELFRELLSAVGMSVTAATGSDVPLTQAEVIEVLNALDRRVDEAFADDAELRAEAHISLASGFVSLRMYEEAEEQTRKALALRQAALGHQHPATLAALTDLGWVLLQARGLRSAGKIEQALALLQAAYDGVCASLSPQHPLALKAAQYLAATLVHRGNWEPGQTLLRDTLEIQRRVLGDRAPQTPWSIRFLAKFLTRAGDVGEGRALAREALRTLAHGCGPEDAHLLLVTMNSLLEGLEAQGRYRAADHPTTRRCLESLISLYEGWGRPDKAAEYRARLTPPEILDSAAELAERLIAEGGTAEQIIRRVQTAPDVSEELRRRALKHVRDHVADTETAAAVYWWFVRAPGAEAEICQAAAEQVRQACRLLPDNAECFRVLGAAWYRTGAYEQALTALLRADELHCAQTGSHHAADAALLAMTCHQLGRDEQARAELERLRQVLPAADRVEREELEALLAEAEGLIGARGSAGGAAGRGAVGDGV